MTIRFAPVKFITILIIGCIYSVGLCAQDESEIADLKAEDYLKLQLPPLSVLFENAKKSPAVEFYTAQKEAAESELKSQKKSWMQYIKGFTSYQYGIVGINSSYSDKDSPLFYQYSGNKQSWYNVGISVTIPMDEIFDHSNRVRKRRAQVSAAEAESGRWHDEQKLRIVEAYTEALKQLSLLKVKSDALILANAQYEVSEYDFTNGKMTIQELEKQKAIQTVAMTEYEETRAQLNNALLKLEILSKTKIINK